MFIERFEKVINFTITKFSLGGSKTGFCPAFTQKNKENDTCPVKIDRVEAAIQAYTHTHTHRHIHTRTHVELLASHQAPPQAADRGKLVRYDGEIKYPGRTKTS